MANRRTRKKKLKVLKRMDQYNSIFVSSWKDNEEESRLTLRAYYSSMEIPRGAIALTLIVEIFRQL
jgi:hypothetical protein